MSGVIYHQILRSTDDGRMFVSFRIDKDRYELLSTFPGGEEDGNVVGLEDGYEMLMEGHLTPVSRRIVHGNIDAPRKLIRVRKRQFEPGPRPPEDILDRNRVPTKAANPFAAHLLYRSWMFMIVRCYDEESPIYKNYGGRGIFVDERWHAFDNYLEDVQKLRGWGSKLCDWDGFVLDKDYYGANKYSPETCIWLERNLNNLYTQVQQPLRVVDDLGDEYIFVSMSECSRYLNSNNAVIERCMRGEGTVGFHGWLMEKYDPGDDCLIRYPLVEDSPVLPMRYWDRKLFRGGKAWRLHGGGHLLKKAREDRLMTLLEVRDATGVQTSQLCQFEGDRCTLSLDAVTRLCEFFDIDLDEFIEESMPGWTTTPEPIRPKEPSIRLVYDEDRPHFDDEFERFVAEEKVGRQHARVYEIFFENPDRGFTASEANSALGGDVKYYGSCYSRLRELKKLGILYTPGKRMCSVTKRNVLEWRLTREAS